MLLFYIFCNEGVFQCVEGAVEESNATWHSNEEDLECGPYAALF